MTFSKENGDQFVGRKALLAKVNEIMKNESSINVGKNLISVVGKSGSGKTVLMVDIDFLSPSSFIMLFEYRMSNVKYVKGIQLSKILRGKK